MQNHRFEILAACALALTPLASQADEPPALPAVAGVLGLELLDEPGWLAVRLDVPSSCALSGILWYNNDETAVYPVLVAGTGYPDGPGGVADMETLATDLAGPSSAWHEYTFPQPIAAAQSGLYLVFEFPADRQFAFVGEGGGAAIGYGAAEGGSPGWISGDGQTWMRLADDAGFALVPRLVPYVEGMLVKSLGGNGNSVPPPVTQPYLAAGPNPFNPQTEIRFGLPHEALAMLAVYDLRGARIAELVHEVLPAGHHSATWTGRDGSDRAVASGVYIARLVAGEIHLTRRVLLLR